MFPCRIQAKWAVLALFASHASTRYSVAYVILVAVRKAGRDALDLDCKPDSPTFYNLEGGFAASPNFFRPPVWTGAGNADDGLLGCQAPAADGLDVPETFAVRPPVPAERSRHQRLQLASLLRAKGKEEGEEMVVVAPPPRPPPFPVEIHLQILSHALAAAAAADCGFCRLFGLSTLSRVSRLYNALLQPHLYDELDLAFNSSLAAGASLVHDRDRRRACTAHAPLASKHEQLERRVPLLLRTLAARPDLARAVRRIVLPPGGTVAFLTCQLEKALLPQLIARCCNVEAIAGVDRLLADDVLPTDHYCLDDRPGPQQHGMLAKALHETTTLRHWAWTGGSAAGRDFAARLWDGHPAMAGVGFVSCHRHWRALEHLEIRNVCGLDALVLARLMAALPATIRRLALVGARRRRGGSGDADTMLQTLDRLPASVADVEIGGTADEGFLQAVGQWVCTRERERECGVLTWLRIVQTPVTRDALDAFVAAIAMARSDIGGGGGGAGQPHWRSAVRRLAIDNDGFEPPPLSKGLAEAASADLRWRRTALEQLAGLDELQWRVRTGGCTSD